MYTISCNCKHQKHSNAIFIMQNTRFHTPEDAVDFILGNKYGLLYFAPYSLFLIPIDNMFGKLINVDKRSNSNNEIELMIVIKLGADLITKDDCVGALIWLSKHYLIFSFLFIIEKYIARTIIKIDDQCRYIFYIEYKPIQYQWSFLSPIKRSGFTMCGLYHNVTTDCNKYFRNMASYIPSFMVCAQFMNEY